MNVTSRLIGFFKSSVTNLSSGVVRLHISEAAKIPKRSKFFVKVTVNDVSKTTRKETMVLGWDEELSL